MHYTRLADRSLIEISGEDAAAFLQGLVSNDVSRLRKGEAVYAALLTPQGKFLYDFFLLPWRDSIVMDCDKNAAPDIAARLNRYKLRSKVTIAPLPEPIAVAALWGGKVPGLGIQDSETALFPDPRLPALGYRAIGESGVIEALNAQSADSAEYDRRRLELGVPDGTRDMLREKSLLLEFGFEDLHGVDFTKGCYVGQEVTARSKYRGQVRRFIYRAQSNAPLPAAGTAVTLDGAPAGELRSVQGPIGLALLKVAQAEKAEAEHRDFEAGGIAFKALLPAWAAHPPRALTIEE